MVLASPQLAPPPVPAQNPFERPCPNCGEKTVKLYCAACGQKLPSYKDYSLWQQLKSFVVEDLVAYDGRVWGTLGALFLRPGKLTREYFDGRRAKYLGPMRIFVLANIALWFVSPYLGIGGFNYERAQRYVLFKELWLSALAKRAELARVSVEQMVARVEAVSAAENQLAVLCLSPMIAVGLWIFLAGKRYRYMQHLIFAAHFFVIHIGVLVLWWGFVLFPLAGWAVKHPEIAHAVELGALIARNNTVQHLALLLPLFPFAFAAVRRAYALTTQEALWRSALFTFWACLVTRSFFDVAFALVLIFA